MDRTDALDRFGSFDDAGSFCQRSFARCNHEYRHSGIAYHAHTNLQKGPTDGLQYRRATTLNQTCPADPERVVRKPPRPHTPPAAAWANRPQDDPNITATSSQPISPRLARTISPTKRLERGIVAEARSQAMSRAGRLIRTASRKHVVLIPDTQHYSRSTVDRRYVPANLLDRASAPTRGKSRARLEAIRVAPRRSALTLYLPSRKAGVAA